MHKHIIKVGNAFKRKAPIEEWEIAGVRAY